MSVLDILTSPWAISEDKLAKVVNLYLVQTRNGVPGMDALAGALGQATKASEGEGYSILGNVAVIPVTGVILKDSRWTASTRHIGEAFKAALGDSSIRQIVFHIHSPGGTIPGVKELADLIFEARGEKPTVAFSDGQMTSAAYYIGAAADRVVISSENVEVGSIGVRTVHMDISKLAADMGYKITDIYAGKYKVVGTPYKPLSKEDRGVIQADLDYFYTTFVDSVARYRGVSSEHALENMADGRIFIGNQGIEAGLVDEIIPFDRLIEQAQGPQSNLTVLGASAAARSQNKENVMNMEELKAKHPELFAQIQAAAREGMIAQADADTASTEAVAAENTRVMALVTAAVGEEIGKKISAAAAKGLTAEDLQTLGVKLAPEASGQSADEESRKQILAGIQGAAPDGLKPAAGKQGEAAERSAAAKAIAAGAGGK